MRRIAALIVSGAIASFGLIGTSVPASASCTVIDPEIGCTESAVCRVVSRVRPTNCIT